MRLEIKAFMHSAEDVIDKADLKLQYILLEKPIYDTFSGELVRTDYYPATIFNEKISTIMAADLIGKKVTAVCYLNSQKSEKDDKVFYNLRLKVQTLVLLKEATKAE